MAHDVVLIPGDGIGPEITSAMRRVVERLAFRSIGMCRTPAPV